MSEQQIQALLIRALKTFVQAFLGAVLLGLTPVFDIATLKALLLSAVAVGISAVMNLYIKPLEAK